MSSSELAKCACVTTAAVAAVIGRTVALAGSKTSHCDVSEYYDVSTGACRHCDTACFEYENGTIVSFNEAMCLQLCPDYIQAPRVPQYPREPEQVSVTLIEGCLFGFLISLFIISIIVVVILRSEIFAALKNCGYSAKSFPAVGGVCPYSSADDVSESSYVKLADPSDEVEVEIIYRVTTV